MKNKSRLTYAAVAGPVIILTAYGISSLLLGENSMAGADGTDMSMAYGLLLWVGAPIAVVSVLPLFGGILKLFTKRHASRS